jgi:hypothetical protein
MRQLCWSIERLNRNSAYRREQARRGRGGGHTFRLPGLWHPEGFGPTFAAVPCRASGPLLRTKKEPTQPMRSAGSSRRRRETTGEKCYFAPTLSWCRLSSYSFYVDAIYRFDRMCRIDRTYLIVQTYRIDRFARSCQIGRCHFVRSRQIDRCRFVRSCRIGHYRSVRIPH